MNRAGFRDDVDGGTAVDAADVNGREGGAEFRIKVIATAKVPGQPAQKSNQLGAVHDGVVAVVRGAGMGLGPRDGRAETTDAFVGGDHPHGGWLADNDDCRGTGLFGQSFHQAGRAQASHFLVIG